MDCAGSARYLLAVATIAMAISLGSAAPIFGFSSQRNTGDSAPSSLLSKLPLPIPLPKISVVFIAEKDQSQQLSATDTRTTPDNKQQDSQQPPQQQPYQSPPKPTVDERSDGKDPRQPLANAPVTTSPILKLETTTEDRSVVQTPLKSCGLGQRFNENRDCVDVVSAPKDNDD